MTHIRFTPEMTPGGAKQIGSLASTVHVIDDAGRIIDISALVLEARVQIKPRNLAVLTLDIAGFELVA